MPAESPEAAVPPAATALFLSAWGHLHGLVILEVFGHTDFLGDHRAEIFRTAILNLLEDVHRRISTPEPERLRSRAVLRGDVVQVATEGG